MPKSAIISLGSVNVDVQVRANRWPEPGETLLGSEFLMIGGGKAANVAFLARRLGVPARLVARVGDDALADIALGPLARAGVDLTDTKRVGGAATGVALIVVRPDGEKAIVMAPNANAAWDAGDGEEVARAIASAASGSVLAVDLEVPVEIVRRALAATRERRCLVVLDPSPATRVEPDLYGVDYLTPNTAEAKQLAGFPIRSLDDAFRTGAALVEQGGATVLVKFGGEGAALVSATERAHVRPPTVRAVDTTGAGDAFTGALSVALLEGRSPLEAARFAVAAAAFAVTRYGSQPSYPTRAELEELVRQTSVQRPTLAA